MRLSHAFFSRLLPVPACLILAACSGGVSTDSLGTLPDAGPGGAVVTDAPGASRSDGLAVSIPVAPDARSDGPAVSVPVPPDAGFGSDARSDGPAVAVPVPPDAGPDAPIDPLVVGNSWTYDVTELGSYPYCPGGSHVGSVASSEEYAGRQAYQVISLCEGLGPYYYSESGDSVSWDPSGTWEILLDSPVVEGHMWTSGGSTFVWHDLGTVAVPAGSFDECFEAEETDGPSYTVFCRGVGPIHWHYDDGAGNGYDALLTGKSF